MTEQFSEAKLRSMLGKVRALLERADHPNTPPGEAATAREKAEEIMRKYRIEEEAALAVDPTTVTPELVTVDLCDGQNDFRTYYWSLFMAIARHCGVRAKYTWIYDEKGGGQLAAQAVGYPTDLRIAEMMFTSARAVFSEHLEPRPDVSLSDQLNCYRLRRSGMERNRIAQLLWGSAGDDGVAHGKVARLYRAECMARGEDAALSGRGISAKVYREGYASGFVSKLQDRLRAAREGVDKIDGGLVLHGRTDRVDAEFYRLFPDARPAGAGAGADCTDCRKTSSKTGKCKAHRPMKWTRADQAAYERRTGAVAQAGASVGARAAESVALDAGQRPARIDDRTADERADAQAVQGILGR